MKGTAVELKPGDLLHNFDIETVERIPEIDGIAYTMRHIPSKARLLYLANNDAEKTFAIGFKTPPADDTGVFHIIEHSVLCGSEKFPVKEPFVHLLKTSMQTFLNAITYPDKTIYPISSTNETDLLNLVDVYMDAVLHPLFYEREATFEQEGWHIETAQGDDGATRLVYNGIVYNEMKGALSDPESKLMNALDAAMFPDTAYGYESGGTPESIPTLSYEELLDVHGRHYNLKNSYIGLYGKLDIDRFLAFLDEKYLTPESERTAQREAGEPNSLKLQAPVRSVGNTVEVVTEPKNCGMAIAYGAGTFADRTRLMGIDILLHAVMGNNEAPLKRTLLDAGLADVINGRLSSGVQQPVVILTLRGMKDGAPERFRRVLESRARELADGALDRKLVEAALLADEFSMCENNYGSTGGLNLYRRALEGWLYDDAQATAYLRFEDSYKELKEGLEQGYFEQLLRDVFCNNPHTADVVSVPIKAEDAKKSEIEKRLEERSRAIDAQGIGQIEEHFAKLRMAQEEPDTPEGLAALPHLELSDLGSAPEEPEYRVEPVGLMRVMRHNVSTRGIVYTERCYDAMQVAYEELQYLSILTMCYTEMDTAKHTVSELNTLIKSRLGRLSFSVDAYEKADEFGAFNLILSVFTSSRADRVADAAQLSREVMTQTVFCDKEKLKRLLVQRLVRIERSISNGSTWFAKQRVQSYYLPIAVAKEALDGIEFYRFLKELVANYDERYEGLVAKLEELSARFYADTGCLMSFVGSDAQLDCFLDAGGSFEGAVASGKRLTLPLPAKRNEAFTTPADVTYSALSYDLRLLSKPFTGSWKVACKALSYDYLWNEVRVKGGAYGGGFDVERTGHIGFSAWRDPHLQRTINCFKAGAAWLERFEPSKAEFEGYIISAVADMDAPKKPRQRARAQLRDFFEGYTPEMKRVVREQAIATTPNDLKAMAGVVQAVIDMNAMGAIGSKVAVERSSCGFTAVDVLGK